MIRLRWLLVPSIVLILVILSIIWTHNLRAASAILQLTHDPATDVRPVWSPDEQRIAFQSNRNGSYNIWIMDADGQNQREVLSGNSDDRHPAWSPDGKKLAFDSDASGRREIWIVDSDGQNPQQITSLEALSNFPSWSPDGARIAFYVYKNGIMDLWTVEVDGSSPQPLTSELANERRNQCTFACHQAAWSSDGQVIAYEGGDHNSIWLIDADGSNPREVVGADDNSHFPWYTSDDQIGYLTEHVNPDEAWTNAWLLDPVSGQVTLLLDHIRLQGPLDWSQDKTKVLFHSPRSGNFDIYLVDLQATGGREALQTAASAGVPPSQHPGPDLEAPEAATDEETQPEASDLEAPEAAVDEKIQPGDSDLEASEAAADEEAQSTTSEVEDPGSEGQRSDRAMTRSRFASPMVLGVIGLVGLLGMIGLIVVISVIRRNRSA